MEKNLQKLVEDFSELEGLSDKINFKEELSRMTFPAFSSSAVEVGAASQADPSSIESSRESTKVAALMQELHQIRKANEKSDPSSLPVKSIVFSQWTSMLNIIQHSLTKRGHKFVRLDGSMSREERAQVINEFQTDPSICVFLISMKAGGLGLNLTQASRVFLLDPWWNPATEDQAIDRVHRIGQTREVVVVRFIIAGSVEERILALQEKKRQLACGALSTPAERARQSLEDLQFLFQ